MDATDMAYLAGLFDGDGCVSIARMNDKEYARGKTYRLIVDVSQKHAPLLKLYKLVWGGSIYDGVRCKRWTVYSKNALKALEMLEPYLMLKKSEALVAIEFQRKKSVRPNAGVRGITDEQFAGDEAAYWRMKELKRLRS